MLDFKAAPIQMQQWNLWKVVPFLVSTRRWGLLWDTSYAKQDLNPVDLNPHEKIPLRWVNSTTAPSDDNSTATVSIVVRAADAGAHWVYLAMSPLIWCSHGVRVNVTTAAGATATVIDLMKDGCNLPPSTFGRVRLPAGKHTLVVESWCFECQKLLQPKFVVVRPIGSNRKLIWRGNTRAAATDYYFMSGGDSDVTISGGAITAAIQQYRKATGAAPMPPKAIMGFMHSKDRYKNQANLTAAAQGFRSGGFPIDTIVQDWYFWPKVRGPGLQFGTPAAVATR